MLGNWSKFRWFGFGQTTVPLLSLILLGIFLTVANSGIVTPHSIHAHSAEAAVIALGGSTDLPDAHDHATQQACHSTGSCTTVAALAASVAPVPGILVTDPPGFDAPQAGIARIVRPDIRPPIA